MVLICCPLLRRVETDRGVFYVTCGAMIEAPALAQPGTFSAKNETTHTRTLPHFSKAEHEEEANVYVRTVVGTPPRHPPKPDVIFSCPLEDNAIYVPMGDWYAAEHIEVTRAQHLADLAAAGLRTDGTYRFPSTDSLYRQRWKAYDTYARRLERKRLSELNAQQAEERRRARAPDAAPPAVPAASAGKKRARSASAPRKRQERGAERVAKRPRPVPEEVPTRDSAQAAPLLPAEFAPLSPPLQRAHDASGDYEEYEEEIVPPTSVVPQADASASALEKQSLRAVPVPDDHASTLRVADTLDVPFDWDGTDIDVDALMAALS